jgi:hypothetical protein
MNSKKVLVGDKTVTVTICLTEDEGLCVADGGKWLLICEEHSSIVQDTNKRRLWGSADEVADWCEECRINDRVTVAECEHPDSYHTFDESSILGDAYYCVDCNELTQVG